MERGRPILLAPRCTNNFTGDQATVYRDISRIKEEQHDAGRGRADRVAEGKIGFGVTTLVDQYETKTVTTWPGKRIFAPGPPRESSRPPAAGKIVPDGADVAVNDSGAEKGGAARLQQATSSTFAIHAGASAAIKGARTRYHVLSSLQEGAGDILGAARRRRPRRRRASVLPLRAGPRPARAWWCDPFASKYDEEKRKKATRRER